MQAAAKKYDVVVFGAGGFTGRLVCEHIARDYQVSGQRAQRATLRNGAPAHFAHAAHPATQNGAAAPCSVR